MHESVPVAEPAAQTQLPEIDLLSSFYPDKVFAIMYPEFVEIFAEVHPFSLVDHGGQLIGRYPDGACELLNSIVRLQERPHFYHIEIQPVLDVIGRCKVLITTGILFLLATEHSL